MGTVAHLVQARHIAPTNEAPTLASLWRQATTLRGVNRLTMEYNLDSLIPAILMASVMCDGDYCDLGESIYRLINDRFRDIEANHV